MKSRAAYFYRGLVIYLCAVLLLPLIPAQAEAQVSSKAIKKVQVRLGKPQVWSIGQAHYLLANMRRVNRDLTVKLPSSDDLNPNAVNATRIQILKTLLSVEGQFSQKDAIGNQAAIRENQIALRNRDEARAALPAKKRELEDRDRDLLKLDRRIKENELKKKQFERERGAISTPPPLPGEEENKLELDIELRKIERAQRKAERDALATEVGELEKTASGTVGGPSVTEPTLTTTTPKLPTGDLTPLLTKALDKAATTTPSVAASIALDNYIAMQYELIAKQMTLLRDELGPEERVIFVELPTSFYTVPCKADNHMIQLHWEVEEYLEDEDRLAGVDKQGLRTNFEDIEKQRRRSLGSQKSSSGTGAAVDEYSDRWRRVSDDASTPTDDDNARPYAVRALDIIPRQSALNVNSTYNTISQVNFLGVLKFITGLGIRVDYQRQQELYEQYLQQEVFASGYGKGANVFGWTFAPLPGTKRVAPGVRTTYAVLAVPRKASALQLRVKAITYSRGGTPNYDQGSSQLVAEDRMIVRIPNEFTERFYVKEAIYTPVRKGQRVGVLLKGDYFSPQLGVSINGVPLTRALSLTSNETLDASAPGAAVVGVEGSFELISSNELYMTFSIADPKVATPTITLVTPEKTSAINFFDLKINYHDGLTSLQEISKTEPMFFDEFKLGESLKVLDVSYHREEPTKTPVPFIKARLDGEGLRRGAEIYVDERHLKQLDELLAEPKKEFVEARAKVEFPGDSIVDAREKLKNKIALSQVDKTKAKLKAQKQAEPDAQKKKLTDDEEKRLLELKREWLNDDQELFEALQKYLEKQSKRLTVEEIKARLTGQNKRLTKAEEERLLELNHERLDDQEFYLAVQEYLKKQNKPLTEVTSRPHDEYVEQESTGAYVLYFKQPQKAKWSVRYRNNTQQGYEEKTFEMERAFPLAHKIASYESDDATGVATVTLEFFTDDKDKNGITDITIPPDEGKPLNSSSQDGDKWRRTFEISPEKGTLARDHITATVTRKETGTQKVTVVLPLHPRITSIENPNHGNKPQGHLDEEPAVVIRGVNLHRVEKVFFGSQEATKVGESGRTEMVVTVPKGEHRPDIKARQVPVRLQTDAASGKSLASNIKFYTYLENGLAK